MICRECPSKAVKRHKNARTLTLKYYFSTNQIVNDAAPVHKVDAFSGDFEYK